MKTHHQGVPLLGFVAPSGTGKTTLLTRLIPLLVARGLRVGCLKHTHHPFEIDRPGKDSHRMREAGARQMLIGSSARWALIVEEPENADPTLDGMLDRLDLAALDLVLVEGFRLESIPKIEIHRRELDTGPGAEHMCRSNPAIIALATNLETAPDVDVPVLPLDDPTTVAAFVLARLDAD